jgi:hypothetical protein
MAPTMRGGQGQCSSPRLADPLLGVQVVKGARTQSSAGVESRQRPWHAPNHTPDASDWHVSTNAEHEAFGELALVMAMRQVAESRGNTLRQQAVLWSPFS